MLCNLKKFMKTSGLSSSSLSEKSGLSVQQIMNIANERSVPKLDTANAIAESVGCQLSDLWPDIGNGSPKDQKANIAKLNSKIVDLESTNKTLKSRLDEATEAMARSN